MLRGPNGYGTDFIWLPGIILGAGSRRQLRQHGDRRCRRPSDLLTAPNAAAPYTGIVDAGVQLAVWSTIGDPAVFPDPVGQLSRFNGTSSAGTWTLLVADNVAVDTGTLNELVDDRHAARVRLRGRSSIRRRSRRSR